MRQIQHAQPEREMHISRRRVSVWLVSIIHNIAAAAAHDFIHQLSVQNKGN